MAGFAAFWREIPSHIDPVLFHLGSFEIRWYGVCYFLAIFISFLLCAWRVKRKETNLTRALLEDYYFWVILGVVIGSRLGYVLFYQWSYYAAHPLEIILPFQFEGGLRFTGISGLSFHGGWLGSTLATWLFCRKHKIEFWKHIDFIVASVPAGYAFGRLGNFLNGELWGRATDSAIGMVFQTDVLKLTRHPSQLYEMAGEGLLIFLILWPLRNKNYFPGWIFCAYAFCYGAIRFAIEYFREPDEQLGLMGLGLSMGQWLCVGMMILGLGLGFILVQRSKFRNQGHS